MGGQEPFCQVGTLLCIRPCKRLGGFCLGPLYLHPSVGRQPKHQAVEGEALFSVSPEVSPASEARARRFMADSSGRHARRPVDSTSEALCLSFLVGDSEKFLVWGDSPRVH